MKEHQPTTTAPRAQTANTQPFYTNTKPPKPEPFYTVPVQAKAEAETETAVAQTAQSAPIQTAETDVEADATSPIRQEVFKLFEFLNKKGVLSDPGKAGTEDADWKAITGYSQTDWNDRKALEAPWDKWRNYKDQLKAREVYLNSVKLVEKKVIKKALPEIKEPEFVARPEGDPITKLTTCILVQTKILARASQNLKLSYDAASLMDPKQMEQSPAWNWASPQMAERPTAGDIFVLISLGDKLKKAKDALSRAQNQSPKQVERLREARDTAQKRLDGWQQKSTDQLAVVKDLEKQIDAQHSAQKKQQLGQANKYLKELNGPIKISLKLLKDAQKGLDDALTAKEKAQKLLAEARTGEQFRTQLFFSHVGFFVSKEPLPDDPTKELWKTFDGGQTFSDGKATKQGAKYVDRVYDPATNEIWAKPHQKGMVESQDGQTRWFLGWYNLDKLVRPKTK